MRGQKREKKIQKKRIGSSENMRGRRHRKMRKTKRPTRKRQ